MMTPKNLHKIFIPQKIYFFLKTPKNIEIQNFEPQKMTRAYVCMKISEYPPPPPPPGLRLVFFIFYSNINRMFGKQTVEILVRYRVLWRLIWVCTVCLCPTKRTLGLQPCNYHVSNSIVHEIKFGDTADM